MSNPEVDPGALDDDRVEDPRAPHVGVITAQGDGDQDPRDRADEPAGLDASANRGRVRAWLRSDLKLGAVLGALTVVVVSALVGWQWISAEHAGAAARQRSLFLQAGRDGAQILTTIRYTDVDADIQRVLDDATGKFRDQFQSGARDFAEVVRTSQTTSTGTISDAGIQSIDADSAQVLVSATVKTTSAGGIDQAPRRWRMRITVQPVSPNTTKVSNVEFVP